MRFPNSVGKVIEGTVLLRTSLFLYKSFLRLFFILNIMVIIGKKNYAIKSAAVINPTMHSVLFLYKG
jgi:hypothetical protein